jgi:hypothetical protein
MNVIANTQLLEPSIADVLLCIAADSSLPADKRTHWSCSLRKIAEALGKPAEGLPARWSAIRRPIGRLHHVPWG